MELLLFILGIVIGSFLNVCIFRLPRGESILYPPSHCPVCNNRLKALDLIPVLSFIALHGKCRYCKTSIPARYPMVELLTGLMFVAVYIRVGLSWSLLFQLFIVATIMVIMLVDLDGQNIPKPLLAILAAGLLGVSMLDRTAESSFNIVDSSLGMLIIGGVVWFLSWLKGDMNWWLPVLSGLAGFWLGWRSGLFMILCMMVLLYVSSVLKYNKMHRALWFFSLGLSILLVTQFQEAVFSWLQ